MSHPPHVSGLDIAQIQEALAPADVGSSLRYLPQTASTMQVAHEQAARGPARAWHGSLILTEEQTAGRGRLARTWQTPPGQAILLSILLAQEVLGARMATLPMLSGLALWQGVTAALPGLAPILWLKWPNDLVAQTPGGLGKVGGILIEQRPPAQGRPGYAVVGMGVNVNQGEADLPSVRRGGLPPTSLALLLGHPTAREALICAICRAVDALLTQPEGSGDLHAAWEARLLHLGQPIRVERPDQPPLTGLVTATQADGALLIRDDAGRVHTVYAGDVGMMDGA